MTDAPAPAPGLRERIHTVIFEADTPWGKAFDVWLIVLILLSVLAVMADSVDSIHERYGTALYIAERLQGLGVAVSRIAKGIPTGSNIEFVGKSILRDALSGRHAMPAAGAHETVAEVAPPGQFRQRVRRCRSLSARFSFPMRSRSSI